MVSYDVAKICEFVRLYFLNQLYAVIDKSSVGLYRDDGLTAMNNANHPRLIRIRKDIIALIKEEGLSITIKQISSKQIIWMLTSSMQQRNTFLFKRLTRHRFSSTLSLTTYL